MPYDPAVPPSPGFLASAPAVLVAPLVVGAGILLAGMLVVFAYVASGG